MFCNPLFGVALAAAVGEVRALADQAKAERDADSHAADAFCYMAGNWRRADDTIDVEAREVPEPRLIGYDKAAE